MIESIRSNLRFNRGFLQRLVADVPEDRLAEQSAGIVNHAAWQVGHLVVTLGTAVGWAEGAYSVPDGWQDRFGMGSTPTGTRADYPAKDQLLEELNRVMEAFEAVLDQIDAATLAKPTPHPGLQKVMPTIGDVLPILAGWHFTFHLGQLSAWRRVVGLPSAM